MLASLTYSTFKELRNARFSLQTDADRPEELILIETEKLTQHAAGNIAHRREPFSLVFRGSKGVALPQRIHTLQHETLGLMEIFLVPIAPDAAGPRYEAVFN